MQNGDIVALSAVVNAAANAIVAIIVVVSAITAYVHYRTTRAASQAQVIVSIADYFARPAVRSADTYVRNRLAQDLEHRQYRLGAASDPWRGPTHRAKPLLNFYEALATLVNSGGLDLEVATRFVSPATTWEKIAPLVAVLRRHPTRGTRYLEQFEALANKDGLYSKRHGASRYPAHLPRPPLVDPWNMFDKAAEHVEAGYRRGDGAEQTPAAVVHRHYGSLLWQTLTERVRTPTLRLSAGAIIPHCLPDERSYR